MCVPCLLVSRCVYASFGGHSSIAVIVMLVWSGKSYTLERDVAHALNVLVCGAASPSHCYVPVCSAPPLSSLQALHCHGEWVPLLPSAREQGGRGLPTALTNISELFSQ